MDSDTTIRSDQVDAHPQANGPILVIIRGVPGSGKSYLSVELVKEIGEDRTVALDPDAIDKSSSEYRDLSESLTAEGVDEKFHAYRYSRTKAYEGIEAGKIIIWNQPFTDLDGFKKTVERLMDYAGEHELELPVLVVEIEIGESTARERVKTRKERGGHGPDPEILTRFIADFRSFADEGYETVAVNGADPVEESVATVRDALKRLGAISS